MPRVSRRLSRSASLLAALVLAGGGVLVPAVPAFAAVVGIDKSTDVRTGIADFEPDLPWELDGVPANATYVIHETDTQGGTTDHPEDEPLIVVIPWDATAAPATAAIVNTFVAPPPSPTPQ